MNKFNERLKELRKDNNLSALKLSKILNVSDTTILRWENGTISHTIENFIQYCNLF